MTMTTRSTSGQDVYLVEARFISRHEAAGSFRVFFSAIKRSVSFVESEELDRAWSTADAGAVISLRLKRSALESRGLLDLIYELSAERPMPVAQSFQNPSSIPSPVANDFSTSPTPAPVIDKKSGKVSPPIPAVPPVTPPAS